MTTLSEKPETNKLITTKRKPYVLIILDGWGYSETSQSNAIADANTPFWDQLWTENPHTLISGSGLDVGLPEGQMGNSEVGHMTLGAGRTIYQDLTRISQAIQDGSFDKNDIINQAVNAASSNGKSVHILGLLSAGGVHSHEDHLIAMVASAAKQGAESIYIHAFLDGRDTAPKSAAQSIHKLEQYINETQLNNIASIASISGRYFAMDRDKRWDRVEMAYSALTSGKARYTASTALEGLTAAYQRGETDEFVTPTIINASVSPSASKTKPIQAGDSVVFINFRADRARQLTSCFTEQKFTGFDRGPAIDLASFVTLTQYSASCHAACAFPPRALKNSLAEYLSAQQKTQLRISETEKYAHVTFFFSGGREAQYPGEDRILIPSPNVATYDLKPEMSAPEVTAKLTAAIESGDYDFVVCNFANGDMVGHTGNYQAAIKAVEFIDQTLVKVITAVNNANGECLITADHGNVEQMLDENTQQPHTAHTCEPVPLIYVGSERAISGKQRLSTDGGTLADIAPTLLEMMQIPQPAEMEGHSLLR